MFAYDLDVSGLNGFFEHHSYSMRNGVKLCCKVAQKKERLKSEMCYVYRVAVGRGQYSSFSQISYIQKSCYQKPTQLETEIQVDTGCFHL